MLKIRTYLQEQMLHYRPWVTDAWKSSLETKLSSLPVVYKQPAVAMLSTASPSQSRWNTHRWRPTGGSGVVPLYDG